VGSLHVCKEVPLRAPRSVAFTATEVSGSCIPAGLCWSTDRGAQKGAMLQPVECIHTESESLMTTIRVKENEPFDVALRRFKRTIEKLGLLTELRAREFYEKPTSERKRKKAAAVKRHYKRVRSMQLPKKLY